MALLLLKVSICKNIGYKRANNSEVLIAARSRVNILNLYPWRELLKQLFCSCPAPSVEFCDSL